ncbi:hypothetical protein RclHR1_00140049 [Rhizophagus clarus]|uniref:FAD-binding domain-containing protein n=1 Tax=Rhizophagus clarus TaxID=94130 RepID=A0A2Z6QDD5_9GLOM|nr:hypothetical protein RclHR1_00140049 [Rhizophagus clarus]
MSTPNNHIPTILIIGAGPGGLLLYHGIQKHLNKNVKKFNVKIFERDIGPQDRWQGYNIGLYPHGIRSLISCLPESLVTRLSEVMPDPIHEKEYHGVISCDHKGTELSRSTSLYFKSLFELAMMPTYPMMSTYSVIISYRNKLRDLMLEGVDIQWGKKCIGYDECDNEVWAIFQDGTRVRGDILIGCDGINSPIRKQKLPHLQLFDYGITQVLIDVALNKKLMDRIIALNGNFVVHKTFGQDGDTTFSMMRIIPIENDITENTPDDQIHYRISLCYTYYTYWDKNINVDDNNPQSVIDHIKNLIRKRREPCELTDILLELVSLAPVSRPKKHEKTFYRTYNPLKRRPVQDINPMSVEAWESTRVTLLGDAIHAMNPFLGYGTNNALQDAESLVKCLSNYEKHGYRSCIREYENEMRVRSSKDVLESRESCLTQNLPKSEYGYLFNDIYLSGKL